MRRFLSNADRPRSECPEHEILRPKRCRMSNKHIEILMFLRTNKH